MPLNAEERKTLIEIRDRCEPNPHVLAMREMLEESFPEIDPVDQARVILKIFTLLNFTALEGGKLTTTVAMVLGIGPLVAAELAADELGR